MTGFDPGRLWRDGIEGKIKVIEYARTHKIPYFGLVLRHAARGD
jgi:CTP synthase (UTP-ammonia lyase)